MTAQGAEHYNIPKRRVPARADIGLAPAGEAEFALVRCGVRAFGDICTSFREIGCKTPTLSNRAVPKTLTAP
jgi:hypothetical protein